MIGNTNLLIGDTTRMIIQHEINTNQSQNINVSNVSYSWSFPNNNVAHPGIINLTK